MPDQFYLYLFQDASRDYALSGVAHQVIHDGVTYLPLSSISHSLPTFSSDPSQSRVTVRLRDSLDVVINYISHPPPSETTLRITEVLATTISGNQLLATEVRVHWSGKIVRVAWKDSFRAVEIGCKTRQEVHFSRETNTESLNPICRFHNGDGRCPVNIDDFKELATVSAISGDISEPTITVASLAQSDNDYYKAGMVRLGDGDMRTVDRAVDGTGTTRVLTLSRAFPSTSVQAGDTVEVFAGDDLTFETCSTVYAAATDNGAAWGGWKLTPNRDYQKDGIQ
jgi:hypothetical protein